ncbi:MAG: hypothetical protein AB7K09_04425, partial [Planctomycetota bacterium]
MTAIDLQDMLVLARQAVKESHRDTIQTWIEAFCRDMPNDLVRETAPESMLEFLMERYAFFEDSLDEEVKVSVSMPGVLPGGLESNCTVIETRMPDCPWIVSTIKTFARVHKL